MFLRGALRMATWNAAFIIAGLLLIALAGEACLRLTKPFITDSVPLQFVDGVGLIKKPNTETRYGKWDDDFFVFSRANSLGFLDREPVGTERAATGCHIAFIGDSYVEAREVPIADKFQVRLEEMAARKLPHLDITAQAYGIFGTGQINQLPYYDEYARRLNPKLVVLVFYFNDFSDNITVDLGYGLDPNRMPFMSAQRDARGNLVLRPPDPEYKRFLLPKAPTRWYESAYFRLTSDSYFAKWVDERVGIRKSLRSDIVRRNRVLWVNALAERPCCAWLQDVWLWRPGINFPSNFPSIRDAFKEEHLPPVLEEALEYTAFGIDQFKRRADRDGARLIILAATKDMGTPGDPQFDRLTAITEPRGIPIISDYDYIVRQGRDNYEGRWTRDRHWNAVGHQWVAEAILEWLKQNQDVCD